MTTQSLFVNIILISLINCNIVALLGTFQLTSASQLCLETAKANTTYLNNVNHLLANFNTHSSLSSFYNGSSGSNPDKVYGYYLCRGDLNHKACQNCITSLTASAATSPCDSHDGWYEDPLCTFRYANHSMYGLYEDNSGYIYSTVGAQLISVGRFYNDTVVDTMERIIDEEIVPGNSTFVTREVSLFMEGKDQKLYDLVQCTPDIIGANCTKCLRKALLIVQNLTYTQGGFASYPKCQMRFDNRLFYNSGWRIGSAQDNYGIVSNFVIVLFIFFTVT